MTAEKTAAGTSPTKSSRCWSTASPPHPHTIVILDCCHSGSGTRNLGEEKTKVRLTQITR